MPDLVQAQVVIPATPVTNHRFRCFHPSSWNSGMQDHRAHVNFSRVFLFLHTATLDHAADGPNQGRFCCRVSAKTTRIQCSRHWWLLLSLSHRVIVSLRYLLSSADIWSLDSRLISELPTLTTNTLEGGRLPWLITRLLWCGTAVSMAS